MTAPPAIGFECRTSPTLVVATIVIAVLAIAAVSIGNGPAWLHGCLIVLIAVYAAIAVSRLLRPKTRSLLWRADGGVALRLRGSTSEGGREVQGAVRTARVIGPLIVVSLHWPPRGRATLWLLPDNLDADTRRRLRMRLGADGNAGIVSGNTDGV